METVVIHGTKDKVMEIMDIYKEYVPEFYNSKNYKWDMIKAIYSNPEYHDDFLGFILFSRRMDLNRMDIRITLMHDMGGLISKDECFLPRVSGYAEHLISDKSDKL